MQDMVQVLGGGGENPQIRMQNVLEVSQNVQRVQKCRESDRIYSEL